MRSGSQALPRGGNVRPPTRGHWLLFGLGVVLLLAMLVAEGFSAHRVGASGTGSKGNTRAPLAQSGPLLAMRGGRLTSIGRPPGRGIAFTFDDGPSPWTPKIAAVLKRNHVPATFFVIGAQAVRYPATLRQLVADGFLIGNHTYSHIDPATVSRFEARLQLDMAQNVIAGITGRGPRLFRAPYSSVPSAVTPRELGSYRDIARRGFVITLTNYNSEDWMRPGVATIVRNALPPGRQGGIIMFHDGGGNRAQTLAGVKRLIPILRKRGFHFVSLSQLTGIPAKNLEVAVTGWTGLRDRMLFLALSSSHVAAGVLTVCALVVGGLTALRMLLLLALARVQSRRRRVFDAAYTPPISVVVPAYNEEVTISRTVGSLVATGYPGLEVIVVDDGSSDRTAAVVEELDLPGVRVLRQENAGKAMALNAGVAAARHELLAMVDADTEFEPDALHQLVQPFQDERVGAVSGNTKVGNRSGILGRLQHIEYVMGFNLDRRAYELLGCMPTVPGAIGAFRRQALEAVSGVSRATLAEDTDVTIAVGRAGWRVVYAQDARAWTEAPSTLGDLWRQRFRWAFGTLQSVWKHKAALLGRDPGRSAALAIPYLALFQIVLPLLAPLIDLFAVFGLLFLNPVPIAMFWLGFNACQLVLAAYAFRLDGERMRPLWALPFQQLVYRQLMYLVVFQAVVTALRGVRLPWQHVERTGEVRVGV